MPRRIVVFALLAVALAALFVRLGVWQLSRLGERKAHNAALAASLREPPVPVWQLPPSSESPRRAFVDGTPDYEHEFVLAGRSMNGSPGVYLITPVRADSSHAVLVNRGWVYSPDASTVERDKWRESGTRFSGYTMPLARGQPAADLRLKARTVRSLDSAAVLRLVPYRVEPLYLVARDSGGPAAPARLPEIELTNGPHLSYAIQWFSFAAIALIGAGIVVARARRVPRDGSTAA